MSFLWIKRGGPHYRLADPDWDNPLDGSYSRMRGGRWNAPGTFPVVYLNASRATARANVRRRFAGRPYAVEDLAPQEAPDLVETRLPALDYVDVVSDDGCLAAGLPSTYPKDAAGAEIGSAVCQPIGAGAWGTGALGIACRSAALELAKGGEELAWFDRGTPLTPAARLSFVEWFWGA